LIPASKAVATISEAAGCSIQPQVTSGVASVPENCCVPQHSRDTSGRPSAREMYCIAADLVKRRRSPMPPHARPTPVGLVVVRTGK